MLKGLLLLLVGTVMAAADLPQAELNNGALHVKL